jgi:hypothetical protein
MNKQQKDLLALICWDLGCVSPQNLWGDDEYHFNLAMGNLKDLMQQLNIKERENAE